MAPIKAKKLRYYADANFKRRVLPPYAGGRAVRDAAVAARRPSGLAIPSVPLHRPRHPSMAWKLGFGRRRRPAPAAEFSETVAYDPGGRAA
ncbi:hypothetical protein ACPA9J_02825 [Pseudomonas aeruginosa]